MNAIDDDLSKISDQQLVEQFSQTGDPAYFEMLKAEERRRTSEKALKQASKANKIAVGSLFIAFASLVVAIIALL